MDTSSLGYIFGQSHCESSFIWFFFLEWVSLFCADNHKMQEKNSDCWVACRAVYTNSVIHISISSNKKPFVSVSLILLYALKLVYYQTGML